MRHSFLGLCLIFLTPVGSAADQNCLTPDAVWSMRSVADPQISADGKSILYVHSWNEVMDDAGYGNLREVSIHGGEPRAITEGKYHDGTPRWSSDGTRIAYIS